MVNIELQFVKSKMTEKSNLLIVSNLYPLPWQPNRAMFNKQQFDYLSEKYDVYILVPVAFFDYFKNWTQIKNNNNLRYFPYFYIPKMGRRFYSWFMFLSIMLSSYKWVKSKDIKFILASWAYPEGVAVQKTAKFFNLPFFLKVHGSDINLYGNIPSRAKQIVSAAQASEGVISVSQALAKRIIEMGVNKKLIKVIYNGVNKNKFYFDQKINTTDTILFIGNLLKTKGVVELMDSFININKRYPSLKLTYIGDGEMFPLLQEKITLHGLEKKIKLIGSLEHELLPAMIRQAKLLVLPSYNEGVPNVILEAMSCGTPVVATAVGGIPEVIEEGISGVLMNSPDVKDVQAGIEKALKIPWSKVVISESAKKFNWDNNIAQLCTLFNKVT